MTLSEIITKTNEEMNLFSLNSIRQDISLVSPGWLEILDRPGWEYYKWIACLVRVVNPKQIIELGAQHGLSAIMMSSQIQQGKVISVDIENDWKFVDKKQTKIIKIVSDSVKFAETSEFILSDTDIWFFDTTHWANQLKAEITAYKKFFKKGSLLLLDDIHIEGRDMEKAWDWIKWEKQDISSLCHFSGFGIVKI